MTWHTVCLTLASAAVLAVASAAEEAHPRLFFAANDLPALRQRVLADTTIWPGLRTAADDLIGKKRIDPTSIAKLGEGQPQVVRGHAIGRPLTEWLETLGFAYQITGDARYGRAGAELLAAAARDLPPDAPPVGPGAFAGARGDILHAVAVGYDWLYGAMTEEERAAAAAMMSRYVEGLLAEAESGKAWWVPNHNFIGVSIGASGQAALALTERLPDRAPDWTARCTRLVERWLNSGFDEQGAYAEGALYAGYGLGNGLLFAEALKRAGGQDLFINARLRRVPHFLAMSLLPGEGVFDARNDSEYGGIAGPQLLLLSAGGDRLAKWLWRNAGGQGTRTPYNLMFANDVKPVAPAQAGEPWAEHFVGRGLAVFRTGWGADDVMFSVECGQYYPGTHNQADKGHVTLYGRGGRWAIDSGYGNNQQPEGKAQTVAHNCVLIDGKGQALNGAGLGTSGRILAYEAGEHLGYALADETEAYQHNNAGRPGIPMKRAHRHTFFLRPGDGTPAYALIVDDIAVDGAEHEFDWLLHTDGDNRLALAGADVTIDSQRGASGGAYIETPEGAGDGGPGLAAFPFTAKAAGEYHVWGRVRATGPELGKSDSFRVRIDDGPWVDWHFPTTDRWTWAEIHQLLAREPTTFRLTAGEHTLLFGTREDGAQLDAVYITTDPDFSPLTTQPGQAIFCEAENAAKLVPPMVIRREENLAAGRCEVRFAWPQAPTLTTDAYMGHPWLHARLKGQNVVLVSVLTPLRAGEPGPELARTDDAGRCEVAVRIGRTEDRLVLTNQTAGGVLSWTLARSVDGKRAWRTSGPGGR